MDNSLFINYIERVVLVQVSYFVDLSLHCYN